MEKLSEMANELVRHMRNLLSHEEFARVLCVIEEGKSRHITVLEAQEAILRIIDASQEEDIFLVFVAQHYFSCVYEYTQSGTGSDIPKIHTCVDA